MRDMACLPFGVVEGVWQLSKWLFVERSGGGGERGMREVVIVVVVVVVVVV